MNDIVFMKPIVSFVMPAYNAEDYITKAINSVQRQSISDWELIIVDDGSTDRTKIIIDSFANSDNRFKVISLSQNSGCCYIPRKIAIENAQSDIIAPLDADDWIEPDYLSILINDMKSKDADIVYPSMFRPESHGHPALKILPLEDFNTSITYLGKELVKETIPNWRIGAGGGIIQKKIYLHCFDILTDMQFGYSDEYLTRLLLYYSHRVTFSYAKYFYRINENSVTQKLKLSSFDLMESTRRLADFINNNYPAKSEEQIKIEIQRYTNVIEGIHMLHKAKYILSESEHLKAKQKVKQTYDEIKWDIIKPYVGHKYFYLLKLGLPFAMRFISVYERFSKK